MECTIRRHQRVILHHQHLPLEAVPELFSSGPIADYRIDVSDFVGPGPDFAPERLESFPDLWLIVGDIVPLNRIGNVVVEFVLREKPERINPVPAGILPFDQAIAFRPDRSSKDFARIRALQDHATRGPGFGRRLVVVRREPAGRSSLPALGIQRRFRQVVV